VIKHVSINITGKVQGVFFRASTKEKADELNVKGFVRNERDGIVYVEAEGNDKDLETFISWCKHGPRLARVERCDVTENQPKGFSDFTITK
jgi:acylphosphatase